MGLFLTLACLFFVGSVAGWVLELFFRRFVSASNPERRWINPGFCTGPYLPLYGCGLCVLYLIAGAEAFLPGDNPIWNKLLLFFFMAVSMTVIEYIAGLIALQVARVRLWDYSGEWGNLRGLICPKFSLIWALLGAVYYLLIHPRILGLLAWFSAHTLSAFFIGMFFGVFAVDVAHAAQLTAKLKQYAVENDVIVRYEALKAQIRRRCEAAEVRYRFFRPFRSDRPLSEHVRELVDSFEKRRKREA